MIGLAGVLLAALALAWVSVRTPDPVPASAPAADFSADRAMADVKAIGSVPHPMGSDANGEVRKHLIARMQALGLSPSVWRGQASEALRGNPNAVAGGRVENVVGVLPGTDPDLPPILLMAHYDAVLNSPGAADDAAGVAAALEAVRAIQARGPARRDIVVLLTDGEEVGLLGARAFFASDPLAATIGAVVNLDVRGAGGRALMFETGPDNGRMIALFARTAIRPTSNSLSVFLYKQLPNDTDFTPARERGLPGLNFAFIDRAFHYHAGSATPSALEPGALQSLGEQALAATDALARAEVLPARAADVTYSSLFGRFIVAYPPWGGWLILALALALMTWTAVDERRVGALRLKNLARGALALVVMTLLAAILLALAGFVAGAGPAVGDPSPARRVLAQGVVLEAVSALAILAAILLSAIVAGRRRGARLGWLALVFALACAAQAAAPTAAFVLAWPLLAGALGLALQGRGWPLARWIAGAVVAGVALGWALDLSHLLHVAMGVENPLVMTLAALICATILLPLLDAAAGRLGLTLGIVALAASLAGALFIRLHDPSSPAAPALGQAVHVQDGDKAWRVSGLKALDPWSRKAIAPAGERIARAAVPALGWPKAHLAPTRPLPLPPPTLSLDPAGPGGADLIVRPARPANELRLTLTPTGPVDTRLPDGRVVRIAPDKPLNLRWVAPGRALVLHLTGEGQVQALAAAVSYTWPDTAAPLPPMPADRMPWGLSGAYATAARAQLTLPKPEPQSETP